MREINSDTYKVQKQMMIGKYAPPFNHVPPPYNTVKQQYSTIQLQYNNVRTHYNPVQYNQVPLYNAPRGDQTRYIGGG